MHLISTGSMSIDIDFNIYQAPTTQLIHCYNELAASKMRRPIEDVKFQAIDRHLNSRLIILEVTAQTPDLAIQLLNRDGMLAVHEQGTRNWDELVQFRMGGHARNKTVFALVNPDGPDKRPQILAPVYIYKHTDPVSDGKSIPGNVASILDMPITDLNSAPTAYVFYEILTFKGLRGAGTRLIQNLFDHLSVTGAPADITYATLSPFRTLAQAYPDLHDQNDLDWRRLAYLHARKCTDGVQRFHHSCGATLADLKIGANKPDSLDASLGKNVMANFRYDFCPTKRAHNKRLYEGRDFERLLENTLHDDMRREKHATLEMAG